MTHINSKCYSTDSGFYIPSFLFLQVNTDNSFENINDWDDATKATFLHEYVHFIQDMSTIYGLFNIIHCVECIKACVHDAKKNCLTNKHVILPMKISNEKVKTNIDLESLYRGDKETSIEVDSILKVELKENGLIDGYMDEMIVEIVCQDTYGQEETLCLGVACIRESMAYEEEYIVNKSLKMDVFPYQIVRKLIEAKYPKLIEQSNNSSIIIIALCDIALNSSNPGVTLIKLLDELYNEGYNNKYSVEKLYAYVLENARLDDNGTTYSLQELFDKASKQAEESIISILSGEYLSQVRMWLQDIFNVLREFRRSDFAFVLNNDPFNLIKNIGYPVMSNEKGEYSFCHPKFDMPQGILILRSILEVFQVLRFGIKSCGMQDFCKTMSYNTDKCMTAPWDNIYRQKLCHFAHAWKIFGLDSINDKIKT